MVNRPKICLILHNLRSAYNVGAIFRTAACLPMRQVGIGVEKIYLTGYTPTPVDRFGRPNRAIAKTALGAEKFMDWKKFSSLSLLLKKLKIDRQLIALEQSPNSVDYRRVKIVRPAAILLGNEVRGLSSAILKQCDLVAEIPMRGRKESLNVGVAAGIALFQWCD